MKGKCSVFFLWHIYLLILLVGQQKVALNKKRTVKPSHFFVSIVIWSFSHSHNFFLSKCQNDDFFFSIYTKERRRRKKISNSSTTSYFVFCRSKKNGYACIHNEIQSYGCTDKNLVRSTNIGSTCCTGLFEKKKEDISIFFLLLSMPMMSNQA